MVVQRGLELWLFRSWRQLEEGLKLEALSWLAKTQVHVVVVLFRLVDVCAQANIVVGQRNLGAVDGR